MDEQERYEQFEQATADLTLADLTRAALIASQRSAELASMARQSVADAADAVAQGEPLAGLVWTADGAAQMQGSRQYAEVAALIRRVIAERTAR